MVAWFVFWNVLAFVVGLTGYTVYRRLKRRQRRDHAWLSRWEHPPVSRGD